MSTDILSQLDSILTSSSMDLSIILDDGSSIDVTTLAGYEGGQGSGVGAISNILQAAKEAASSAAAASAISSAIEGSSGASIVGFTATVAGAVQRTIAGRLSDVLSVRDFGLISDWIVILVLYLCCTWMIVEPN